SCLQSKASTTLSLACAPTAPNSSARWPSTRTSTDSAACEALRASSSRWPRNSSEAFTAFGETGGALGAPSTRSHGSQPSCFLAYCAAVLLGALFNSLRPSSAVRPFARCAARDPGADEVSAATGQPGDETPPPTPRADRVRSPGGRPSAASATRAGDRLHCRAEPGSCSA